MGSVILKRFTFIKNAFILTATALILRTIGIFFRIYLSNRIGAEGMGLYQLIFSVYMLATTFATSGICIAVTRLVSEQAAKSSKQTVVKILNRSLMLSTLLGLIAAAAIYFGADLAAMYWLHDMRAALSLRILAPSLPFMAAASCLRGYFIARRKVSTPSNAQLFEQLIRIAVTVALLARFLPMGLAYACAAVVIGNTVSEIASCLYTYLGYRRDMRKLSTSIAGPSSLRTPTILRKLLHIGLPLMGSSFLNTALHTLENLLVPDALTRYTSSKETSLSQFGMLKGMAMPILFFPSSFLSALSTLLIPEISESNSLQNRRKTCQTISYTMQITITLSILISGIFTMFATELGTLIYKSEEVGSYIRVLAPIVPFMYLENVIDGILKGLDQQVSSLSYSVLDSVLRITLITFLVPSQGIYGFLIIMVISNLVTSFLKLHRLVKVTSVRIEWGKWMTRPVLAMLISSFLAVALLHTLPTGNIILAVTAGILTLAAAYGLLLLLFGCITKDDLKPLARRS